MFIGVLVVKLISLIIAPVCILQKFAVLPRVEDVIALHFKNVVVLKGAGFCLCELFKLIQVVDPLHACYIVEFAAKLRLCFIQQARGSLTSFLDHFKLHLRPLLLIVGRDVRQLFHQVVEDSSDSLEV
jgi:hypothetical protein